MMSGTFPVDSTILAVTPLIGSGSSKSKLPQIGSGRLAYSAGRMSPATNCRFGAAERVSTLALLR